MALLLFIAVFTADPVEMTGTVVRVKDGDTLVLLVGTKQVPIRLDGIDAPEKKQAFGQRSKEHLSELVFGRDVRFVWRGNKHRDRLIGTIYVGDLNANRQMVEDGFAWHYVKYSREKRLSIAEHDAREFRRGLWAGPDSVPPWDWRNRKR